MLIIFQSMNFVDDHSGSLSNRLPIAQKPSISTTNCDTNANGYLSMKRLIGGGR